MIGPMTHIIQPTREEKGTNFTYRGWCPEGLLSPCARRGGKHDTNITSFCTTRLAAFTHLLSNVMWSKHFLSHLILNWYLKNDEKSLHCHTIPSFASSRSPFWLFLTFIRRVNIVHDITNVEQHKLLGIDAGRPLSDVTPKRIDSLAVAEGVQSSFFWAIAAARAIGHVLKTML